MDCPLLVWMLFLNREMTPEVSADFGWPKCLLSLHDPLKIQEYDQCHNTIRVCVPHANVPYARDQLDTTRKWIIYENLRPSSIIVFRADNRAHASATHDAAPKSSSIEMERHGQRQRKALHRAGAKQLLCRPTPLRYPFELGPSEWHMYHHTPPCFCATPLCAAPYLERRPFIAGGAAGIVLVLKATSPFSLSKIIRVAIGRRSDILVCRILTTP